MYNTKFSPNYKVGKDGKVFSLKTNKFLKPQKTTNGYLQVALDRKLINLHKLILETFVDRPNDMDQINHINGNKLDNRLCNLEYSNQRDNCNKRELLNKTQYGVSFDKSVNTYKALLWVNNKRIYLGSSKDYNKAIEIFREGYKRIYNVYPY